MKPFSASVQWGIVLLQNANARVQSFIELLQRGNAHDAMRRWITSKSESLVDKMMMNCYKIKTERMKRYGWIRLSWITESGNEQIGLRWKVVHLTKTFVAYLLNKPQSFIRLFCANKHSFNLTQQGIPYFIKVVLGGKSKLNERAVIKVSYHRGTVYVLKLKGIIRMFCRLLSRFSKLIWEEIVFWFVNKVLFYEALLYQSTK